MRIQAAAVPTQPAGKKQAKGRTTAPDVSLTLDADWLAEHASQVAGLLPGGAGGVLTGGGGGAFTWATKAWIVIRTAEEGWVRCRECHASVHEAVFSLTACCSSPLGVSVLGFYLVASEQAYASALPQLCNLADGLRDGSGTMGGRGGGGSPPMLLHVSATMGKLTAKEVPSGAAAAASLRPVELKTGPVLYNFMAVSCQYRVDCWAPIPQVRMTRARVVEPTTISQVRMFHATVKCCGRVLGSPLMTQMRARVTILRNPAISALFALRVAWRVPGR